MIRKQVEQRLLGVFIKFYYRNIDFNKRYLNKVFYKECLVKVNKKIVNCLEYENDLDLELDKVLDMNVFKQ